MKQIFDHYSSTFAKIHVHFMENAFMDMDKPLRQAYQHYAVLDKNYPRPLLTLLGMNYMGAEAPSFTSCADPEFLLIPQLLRDVLAIHDDIIDEDTEKFHEDTLPFSYGKIFAPSVSHMTKEGKDLALLFGDYLFPKIYELIIGASIPVERKLDVMSSVNRAMIGTNIGQIDELIMQHSDMRIFTPADILQMYQRKAANYCYAFPFELGAVYAGAPKELISQARSLLLQIGAASQVVDDLMGVFPEALGETKSTLSDLLYLRRSYVLVLLAQHGPDDEELCDILAQRECTETQAVALKKKICQSGALHAVVETITEDCKVIQRDIEALSVGAFCKFYFQKLVQSRINASLNQIILYYGL